MALSQPASSSAAAAAAAATACLGLVAHPASTLHSSGPVDGLGRSGTREAAGRPGNDVTCSLLPTMPCPYRDLLTVAQN